VSGLSDVDDGQVVYVMVQVINADGVKSRKTVDMKLLGNIPQVN